VPTGSLDESAQSLDAMRLGGLLKDWMDDLKEKRSAACPRCRKPLDPLRAPAVSVIEGRITHFCSPTCREQFLNRSEPAQAKRVEKEASDRPDAETRRDDDTRGEVDTLPASTTSVRNLYRSKLLTHQLIRTGTFTSLAILTTVLPPYLGGRLLVALAALGLAVHLVLNLVQHHSRNPARLMEALAPFFASTAVLVTVFFGLSPRVAGVVALMMLAAESAGHLLELTFRLRSGVLVAVEGRSKVSLASSWRDNSEMASRIRRISIALHWARYPLALAIGTAVFFITAGSLLHSLLAGATALLAVNPRTLRMATGDAHLRAALLASRRGVSIRDAFEIGRGASAQVVLFMAKRSLLKHDLSVVDWKTAEQADEEKLIDALHAVESNATGRFATAIRQFTKSRKARASSPVSVERIPGAGVMSDTPWGKVVCGSRELLLENGISTALMEPQADTIESSGRRAVFLAVNDRVAAVFGVEEAFLPNVPEEILKIQRLGLAPQLMTSASVKTATALGERLRIETVYFDAPEENVGELLQRAADTGARVILVGHGPAFEENLRGAETSIAVLGKASTQAGLDARQADLSVIPWLFRVLKRAEWSARVNFAAGTASALVGLGTAISWVAPGTALFVASMNALVAASCTFNAPFPYLSRLASTAAAPLRGLGNLTRRLKTITR
jgi:YHS domain-containing protein